MGYPLASVFANHFMGHLEKIWLDKYLSSQVLFYLHYMYVNDTFCFFHTENDTCMLLFFDDINTRHPNVGFTMEREVEKELQFLDILRNGLLPPRATLVLLSCLATSCLHSYLHSCIVHCYHFLLHKSHSSLINTVFCTKTFSGLLTHYFSFVPVTYKLGLFRTLVDRVYKINNTWLGFMKTLRS